MLLRGDFRRWAGAISSLVFGLVVMCATPMSAQSRTTVRVVADADGQGLAGVLIRALGEDGANKAWVTDEQGRADLDISSAVTVRLSYMGFLSLDQELKPGSDLLIRMKEDLLGLDEVVVTGSFIPTTSTQSLHQVKTLDAAVIGAKGAVNLSDVLQTQLNMKVIQDDVLGSRVVMMGISGPNVKILVDGLPMVNGTGGNFDLTQFNMNNVERIEIVEGPLAVQYGTNALAGTINIITKNYGSGDQFVNVGAYYETVGQYNVDVGLAKGWDKLSVSVGGTRNRFDGFSSSGERDEDWVPRTQYLTNAKLKYRFKSLAVTAAYDQLWQSSISHGEATSAFNSKTSKLSEIASDYYFDTDRINGSLLLNGALGKRHYLNLVNGVSYYSQGKRKYLQDVVDDFKWLSSTASDHDTTSFITWTSRGTYVWGNTESHEGAYVTAGYEVSVNSADGGKINSDADVNIQDYGIFAAVEAPVGAKLTVQPALRYAYSNKYDTRDIDFLSARLPVLPSFNLKYRLNNNLDFRFSYGQGYRTPSVRELYYEFINSNHYIVGNTELQPEIGHYLNLSSSWRKTNSSGISFAVRPSVFMLDFSNKIELVRILDLETLPEDVSKSTPVLRTYDNIPNFKSMGFNIELDLVARKGLQLTPGFGMLATSGSESDDHFYRSYEANLNASYYFKELDVKFSTFYKYNGNITQFSKDENGDIGVLTLDTYHTLDMSLSRPFWHGRLFATAGAKNLFDVTDVSLTGDGNKGLVSQTGSTNYYPISWGRSFFIKINYTIQ